MALLVVYFVGELMETVWDVVVCVPYIVAAFIFEALATPITIDHLHRQAVAEKESEE